MNKNKLTSFLVFSVITMVVLGEAGFSVKKSLEKGSNIELASSFVGRRHLASSLASSKVTESKFAAVLSAQTKNTCDSETLSSPEGFSVVNFLYANGADSSFTGRSVLAAKIGIADYRGTADQNLHLLSSLKQGLICIEMP